VALASSKRSPQNNPINLYLLPGSGHFHGWKTILAKNLYNPGMRSEEQLYLGTVERARKQSALLLRLYEAEFAADPTSYATESSRSNLMALRHTIAQMYGDI
jgi:hypothetical protein